MYKLVLNNQFKKRFRRYAKRNNLLEKRILDVLELISTDPFNRTLRTHKADILDFGIRWSSRVNGDLRIIWDFDEEDNLMILVLTIGGHSVKNKVYK